MRAEYCTRCETVGRKPKKNAKNLIQKDYVEVAICDECLREIEDEEWEKEYFLNEIQANEDAS